MYIQEHVYKCYSTAAVHYIILENVNSLAFADNREATTRSRGRQKSKGALYAKAVMAYI